jgi:putative hydrolase of the HAD superfamily
VIYDIPLLLENPDSQKVDYVLVVTADSEIQKRRVLSRPNMTLDKFQSILSKQMPDNEKREKADFLIRTDYRSYAPAKAQVARIIETLIEAHPSIWSAWKSRTKPTNVVPSNNDVVSNLFDIVIFDLDDTLAPVGDVLMNAAAAMMSFMEEKMPLTAAAAKTKLKDTMIGISKENMLITHDLTEVRREALFVLSSDKGEESKYVDDAIDVFIKVRSNVTAYLYEDVKDCLDWLSSNNVMIGVLTNGNADLSCCSVLSRYITFSIGAGDVGAKKPSPVPFVAAAQRAGVPCNRILFVGDNHHHDVIGAKNVGMKTVFLNRNNDNAIEKIEADIITQTLSPSVFKEKLKDFSKTL